MLVILDTNILITFSITNHAPIKLIREAWLTGKLEIAMTDELIAEYTRVTSYKHLAKYFQGDERQDRIDDFCEFGIPISISEPYPEAPDPGDKYLFAMLEHPQVACLVTGDKALLKLESYQGKPILSPAEFVQLYFSMLRNSSSLAD